MQRFLLQKPAFFVLMARESARAKQKRANRERPKKEPRLERGPPKLILLVGNLAAAVALLLWSVRLIRTGVERAYLTELRRGLRRLADRPLSAATGGIGAAMILQSSTAVVLIAAGFAASGMLAVPTALAVVLGADLGSALMSQVLVLPVQGIAPFLLLAGVLLFFNARTRKTKQIGRIAIGFALVLMSIGMIREVTEPIGANPIVQSIAAYFDGDLISAFAIGAILAWIMHSSLAAVLTFATFAGIGIVSAPVAVALVLGANLGGAAIPLYLMAKSPAPARQVVYGNLAVRGGVMLAFLALLHANVINFAWLGTNAGQQAISLHILVNTVLLLGALPFSGAISNLVSALAVPSPDQDQASASALDPTALGRPRLALACAQRELLRMGETVQSMLVLIVGLFREWDEEQAKSIERMEDDVDRMHYETKLYVAKLRDNQMNDNDVKRAVELVAMANHLEEAGDRISAGMMSLARKLHADALSFSDAGMTDFEQFHDQIAANGKLALSVLTTGDAEAARQLVEEKDRVRREEQRLQEDHLQRLRNGESATVETTNIHQEVLRQLKQVNAAISYVAYPIAEETGDLLGSRLANTRDDRELG